MKKNVRANERVREREREAEGERDFVVYRSVLRVD